MLSKLTHDRAAKEGELSMDWWTEAAQDVIRHVNSDSSRDWRNAIVCGLLRAYNRGKDAATQPPQELVAALKAILCEESHNETCSSLFGGTQPLCDCWKSKIEAALTRGEVGK